MQGPGKSWNFLGYYVGGVYNDTDAKICVSAHLCQLCSFFSVREINVYWRMDAAII